MGVSDPNWAEHWPNLSGLPLRAMLRTLHPWTHVVGKVRPMLTSRENHGWQVPFYLTPGGLATGLVPVLGRGFTVAFDLLAATAARWS